MKVFSLGNKITETKSTDAAIWRKAAGSIFHSSHWIIIKVWDVQEQDVTCPWIKADDADNDDDLLCSPVTIYFSSVKVFNKHLVDNH